jgi:hypothetical protein
MSEGWPREPEVGWKEPSGELALNEGGPKRPEEATGAGWDLQAAAKTAKARSRAKRFMERFL